MEDEKLWESEPPKPGSAEHLEITEMENCMLFVLICNKNAFKY